MRSSASTGFTPSHPSEIVVNDNAGRFNQGLEDNRLIVEALPSGELKLIDQVPLVPKTSTCLAVTSFEVRCIRASNSPISKLVYRAHGGDDQLRPAGSLPIRFEAGAAPTCTSARAAAPGRASSSWTTTGSVSDLDLAHYTNAPPASRSPRTASPTTDARGWTATTSTSTSRSSPARNFDDRLVGRSSPPGVEEEFRPRGGDDVVLSSASAGVFTVVDMGAAKDGADTIVSADEVSYAQRTNPIRASVGLDGADDGEAGEGDELVDVGTVRGGSGADTMFSANRRFGITLDGGAGDDKVIGTAQNDRLTGGPGRDFVFGDSGSDRLFTDDFDIDRVLCGDGLTDVARTDTAEEEISGCETVERVGKLALAPKALTAEAGETARLRLSWTHPQSWRKLHAITLKLRTRDRVVGRLRHAAAQRPDRRRRRRRIVRKRAASPARARP